MAWYDRFMQQGQVNIKPTQLPDWWGIGRQVGADMRGIRQGEEDEQKKQALQAAINEAFAENKKAGGNESALYSLIAQKTISIDPEYSQKYSELANSTRYSEAQKNPDKVTLSELGKQLMIERRQLQGQINRPDFTNLSADQQKALNDRLSMVDSKLKQSDPIYFASLGGESPTTIAPQGAPISPTSDPSTVTPSVPATDSFPADIEAKINGAQDTKRTGQMDNTAGIIADIDAWALKTGKAANDREVIRLKSLVENRNSDLGAIESARKEKEDKSRRDRDESATRGKESFTAFKESTKTLFDAVASGIGLGQAVKPAIEKALREKRGKLDMNESQKLAALAYQAYNPGTLVAGEMSSAITAAKGGEVDTQLRTNFLNRFGITSNEIPIDKAIEVYNSAMDKSINAYSDYSKQSKGLEDNSLLKSYNAGIVNPSQYYFKSAADPSNYKQTAEGQSIKTPQGTGTVGKGGVIILQRKKP